MFHEALFYNHDHDASVRCLLCPRSCRIAPGRTGVCGVRKNIDGTLRALTYGQLSAIHVDPIEKKPLFHFLPGTPILSIGTVGCTLDCRFCQNWTLVRGQVDETCDQIMTPKSVVALAIEQTCPSIAFTYNEPTVFAEYVMDVSRLAKQAGLRTVMVTNGYVSLTAIPDIYRFIDAANVDLKSFSDRFYREQTNASLQPVLDALDVLHSRGIWLELTTLLIPGLNDGMDEIRLSAQWIREHLGRDTPWHLTAFYPAHLMTDHPHTPLETLQQAQQVAHDQGLRFVYLGNVGVNADTLCPECGRVVISRTNHVSIRKLIGLDKHCPCGATLPVTFE